MRTQDGAPVDPKDKDELLVVEHSTWRRRAKQADDELSARVPTGPYVD